MAFEITGIDGDVVRIRIRGLMKFADQKELQNTAGKMIEQGIKPRLLVTAEHFEGWERSEQWGDIGFLVEYGDKIAKIAVIGDESWKEQVFLFTGKGLRSTEIEFFALAETNQAEQWIRA